MPSCFVAGTLIHTQEGLRPIEQIDIGDFVLSKSESGGEGASYKRVVKTYEYDEKEVYFVSYEVYDEDIALEQRERGYVIVTGSQPFWVRRLVDDEDSTIFDISAWLSVDKLFRLSDERIRNEEKPPLIIEVELHDGRSARLGYTNPILCTANPYMGLVFWDIGHWSENCEGIAIDFSGNSPMVALDERGCYKNMYLDVEADEYEDYSEDSIEHRSGGYHPLLKRVYNIEVEDNHTYFVGKAGLLVGNRADPVAISR